MGEQYFNVGKIVNTQGIRGEVRVITITDFPEERFKKGQVLFLHHENFPTPLPLTINSHRVHKQFDLLTFVGYSNINDVEPFKGGVLKIKDSDRQPLPEGEFYFDQIIGSEVITDTGENLGTVKEIFTTGANDVWVVQRKQKADLLLPYIDDVIKEVDIEQKRIIVHLLEGLEP